MMTRILLIAAVAGLSFCQSAAQCSDAGVCSIGHRVSQSRHEISLTYQFGRSSRKDDLTFHSLQAGIALQIFDESRLSFSLPWNSQSGPLGSISGVGDLTLVWSQTILENTGWQMGFQIGGKLAIAKVNAGDLPQAYQSGLGTNDLLIGVAGTYENWNITLAYQFSQERSANRIDRLKRGDDVLFRMGYTDKWGDWDLGGEILGIKRLQKSSVRTSLPGAPEVFGDLPDSDQAQVNVLGRAGFRMAEKFELRGMLAFPLLERKVNVDGLTRSISLSVGVAYLF